MATKRELPNLENATPGFLIDAIKEQRDIQKDAKFLEGVYREALDSRKDEKATKVEGEKNIGVYTTSFREGLDTDKIKKEQTPEWVKANSKVSEVVTLKIDPKE